MLQLLLFQQHPLQPLLLKQHLLRPLLLRLLLLQQHPLKALRHHLQDLVGPSLYPRQLQNTTESLLESTMVRRRLTL
jgi:hypothetical protein